MEYERSVATARAALDEATFAAVFAEGQRMSFDQAIAYALEKVTDVETIKSETHVMGK
jgi:hypothetical protein